jgi:hypothetical protein
MEFHIIDAPHVVENDPPAQYYVERGIKGPYKSWFKIEDWSEKDPLR